MFDVLQYPFFQHALLAGSFVAIIAAVVGYFLVIRGLTFAGHALAHVGFAGAAGAVLIGINPLWGLLAFTLGAGSGIGLLGKEIRARDLAIGILMTFALGLGMLFLSLYSGFAEQAYSILFGDILGISATNVLITAIFALCTLLILLVLLRPLLFSSFDQEVAEARGVPVQALGIGFLLLVAVTVSMSVQVIGVLLIFTLLIGPAATAMRIVSHPLRAIVLATSGSACSLRPIFSTVHCRRASISRRSHLSSTLLFVYSHPSGRAQGVQFRRCRAEICIPVQTNMHEFKRLCIE